MMNVLFYSCLAVVLLIASWQDIKNKKIKNVVSVIGAVAGLVLSIIHPEYSMLSSILGFLTGLGLGMLCWVLKIFHAGDAKLFCAVGAFVGWKMTVNCILLALVIGAIVGIPFFIVRLKKKDKKLTQMPFAPSIAIACLVGIQFGHFWEWFQFM